MEARMVVHTKAGQTVETDWASVSRAQLDSLRNNAAKHASGDYDLWSRSTTGALTAMKRDDIVREFFIPEPSIDCIEIQTREE